MIKELGTVKRGLDMDKAKLELSIMESNALLPGSRWAGFIQLMGVGAILLSLFSLIESPGTAVAGMIVGGFIIAAGNLQQVVFDIRTLMLRDAARKNELGLVVSEND